MAAQTSPTLRRLRLARRLRELREQAGLTLAEAARRLDKTRSSLGRVEQGKTRADVHLVRTMMDIYDIRDDSLLDLAREAAKKGWAYTYGIRDRGFTDLETEASQSLNLELLYIPGLLQTEDYMRVVFSSGRRRRTAKQVENDVAVRLHRQRRLIDREAPLKLAAIVDESALHWPIGGADVMRAQLRHLIERSELETVTLQVLKRGPKPHDGMNGAFTVLRFPEDEDPDVLFVNYPAGAIYIEDLKGVEEVKEARLVFDELASEALSPRDSVALIERVAREPMPDLTWRKSSRSGSGTGNNCVEVAFAAGVVGVRDSKNPTARLTFTRSAWRALAVSRAGRRSRDVAARARRRR